MECYYKWNIWNQIFQVWLSVEQENKSMKNFSIAKMSFLVPSITEIILTNLEDSFP